MGKFSPKLGKTETEKKLEAAGYKRASAAYTEWEKEQAKRKAAALRAAGCKARLVKEGYNVVVWATLPDFTVDGQYDYRKEYAFDQLVSAFYHNMHAGEIEYRLAAWAKYN